MALKSEICMKYYLIVVMLLQVLKHLGEWGPYQKTLYFMLCIPACLPAAFLAFNQVGRRYDQGGIFILYGVAAQI